MIVEHAFLSNPSDAAFISNLLQEPIVIVIVTIRKNNLKIKKGF